MSPEIWGRYGWDFIHLVTCGYPKNPTQEDKDNYYRYFMALQHVLPCGKCRKNMGEHLLKNPLNDEALRDRESMIKWGIDMHNIVNYYTGKDLLTYPEARKEIDRLAKKKNTSGTSPIIYIGMIVIALIIIYMIYMLIQRK